MCLFLFNSVLSELKVTCYTDVEECYVAACAFYFVCIFCFIVIGSGRFGCVFVWFCFICFLLFSFFLLCFVLFYFACTGRSLVQVPCNV